MLKQKYKKHLRRGTRLVTKLVESTGVPQAYSASIAWFAERMVIASLALAVFSFTAGVVFITKLSQPIADSPVYGGIEDTALLAERGIRVFSQEVIDITSPVFAQFIKENRSDEDLKAEQIAKRKAKLRVYLKAKKSPFAEDEEALEAFASARHMKMMVAISFVESTFGKNCYYYNCSGIGGTPPNLRKYNSYAEWIRDFDTLLENRYKDLPVEKFVGLYVQPGSPNWIYGVKQVLREFDEQGIEV